MEATQTSNKAERRQILRETSKRAKELQATECEEMTINEILINRFYKTKEHQEFNTLYEWNRKGFKVLKGSTAFAVWGKPKPLKKEDAQKSKKEEDENEDEFFPICYLFSNAQVTAKDA